MLIMFSSPQINEFEFWQLSAWIQFTVVGPKSRSDVYPLERLLSGVVHPLRSYLFHPELYPMQESANRRIFLSGKNGALGYHGGDLSCMYFLTPPASHRIELLILWS
jgi:hypothetical protein